MRLHFVTQGGKTLNIDTQWETYNTEPTEYHKIRVSASDYVRLMENLDFNMFAYSDDLDPIPFN